MTRLAISEISSPAELGLAVYEKVQELTQGRARKAATFLSAITCMELDGHDLPVGTAKIRSYWPPIVRSRFLR